MTVLHTFVQSCFCIYEYLLGTITNCLELFRICLEEYLQEWMGSKHSIVLVTYGIKEILNFDSLLVMYSSTVFANAPRGFRRLIPKQLFIYTSQNL